MSCVDVVVSGGCPNLVSLVLEYSSITDEGLKAIATIATLKGLAISNNSFITDAGIGHLVSGQLTQLRSLDLNYCNTLTDWVAVDCSDGLGRYSPFAKQRRS